MKPCPRPDNDDSDCQYPAGLIRSALAGGKPTLHEIEEQLDVEENEYVDDEYYDGCD